ncbi:unnamed protein product, partial [Brassica rapa]
MKYPTLTQIWDTKQLSSRKEEEEEEERRRKAYQNPHLKIHDKSSLYRKLGFFFCFFAPLLRLHCSPLPSFLPSRLRIVSLSSGFASFPHLRFIFA